MARTAREDSRRTKYPFRICRIAGDSHPHTCAFRSSWSPFIAAFMSPFCFPNLAVLRVESDCGAPFGCTFSLTNRGVIQLSTALSRLEWLSFESPCSQNSCATPQYHASSPYLLVASICGPYGFTLSPQISVIWFLSEDPELRASRDLPTRCELSSVRFSNATDRDITTIAEGFTDIFPSISAITSINGSGWIVLEWGARKLRGVRAGAVVG